MDVVDDAEGPLDPRIQIELENLNSATDVINKLEIELDEAHTAFGQLWSESTRRLKDIANKVGASCIERTRCYYQALDVARQAQVQCQHQAQQFQRASEIHKAAKETEALAVDRFKSHQHEWNFDQAWQEMLNHATIKVMDAENRKAECAREHHRRATLFQEAETKVQQLQEKYRRSIVKAEPYFDVKSQYEQMLATQKERVEYLQKAVKDAKRAYSSSFRALEDISNQIHQQRRDYDMVANGPREPGVGAELISPEDSLNYETDLSKISISRVDSLASSSEPDTSDRSKDFDDVRDLQQRVDQLGGRSIDGSESFSSQWELELQASMEKLNNLTMKESNWKNSANEKNSTSSSSRDWEGCANDRLNANGRDDNLDDDRQNDSRISDESPINDRNEHRSKLPMDYQILKKSSPNASPRSNNLGWQSLAQSPINSIFNRSKIAIRNSISKSLSNSPVNMSFRFGKSRNDDATSSCDDATSSRNDGTTENCNDRISSGTSDDVDENLTCENSRVVSRDVIDGSRTINSTMKLDLREIRESDETEKFDKTKKFAPKTIDDSKKIEFSLNSNNSEKSSTIGKLVSTSHSVDSTPAKTKIIVSENSELSSKIGNEEFLKITNLKIKCDCKTSSVRELPLLSLFETRSIAPMSKDKSCSMINLADKRNLKNLLDNSDLRNIQAVSVERLANARNNLMGRRCTNVRKNSPD